MLIFFFLHSMLNEILFYALVHAIKYYCPAWDFHTFDMNLKLWRVPFLPEGMNVWICLLTVRGKLCSVSEHLLLYYIVNEVTLIASMGNPCSLHILCNWLYLLCLNFFSLYAHPAMVGYMWFAWLWGQTTRKMIQAPSSVFFF